ncbi:NUMOD3 domain-containing DNA-binding protein [Bacillus subtilis]|uniref:NUMOD3 domain-containing DNA-binding protein n=1 Tax=Bacillus subtilis TaxID=1423 RepID=UPI00119A382F|nr:NUMOD3 domain-containing DNA-binding protein [Bacillus subtilis]TWG61225.1 NUMOD3 motif-containing protein [Bacillus subtilis J24]TWG69282.1 NUMOD3 motif-containing protein [Bacillus subtilis J26]
MPPKGFKHSKESKEKISKALKGRKLSEETKQKMSLIKVGHPFYGKRDYKMSNKAKSNIRKGIIEKRHTAEYIEKIAEKKRGELNPSSKLSQEQVKSIRSEYELLINNMKKTEAQNYLAKRYGVKRPTISDIVLYKTWKHI